MDGLLNLLGLNGGKTVEELLNKRFSNFREVYTANKQRKAAHDANILKHRF